MKFYKYIGNLVKKPFFYRIFEFYIKKNFFKNKILKNKNISPSFVKKYFNILLNLVKFK